MSSHSGSNNIGYRGRRNGELAASSPPAKQPKTEQLEQPSLPPVASVILDHHLSNISDENDILREENERMKGLREILTSIKIANDNDEIVSLNLADGVTVPESALDDIENNRTRNLVCVPFHSVPPEELTGRLLLSLSGAKATPLSALASIKVTRGGQTIGSLCGIENEIPVFDEPNPFIVLAEDLKIQGKISGLSNQDLDCFRDGTFGAKTIIEYLDSGTGLENPENVMFTPFGYFMDITPGVRKILDLLRPMDCDYPSDSVATLVKPTEYELSRRSIVTTIGCNDAQMTVLKDNESLKYENATLEAMGDLLGTVEIPCSAGSLTFHLKQGQAGGTPEGKLFWVMNWSENEDLSLPANDLSRAHPLLLGVPMYVVPPGLIRPPDDGEGMAEIRLQYCNGTFLYGKYDSSSVHEADFPTSDTPVKLSRALLDFELIKDTLDLLGISYFGSEPDSDSDSEGTEVSEEEHESDCEE